VRFAIDGRDARAALNLGLTVEWVFVRLSPNKNVNLYMRVHPCVVFVACETCGAVVDEPCRGKNGPTTYTHKTRRQEWTRRKKEG
jgi:hypothetical protein